jgi:soluble cytochrome b562
VYLTRHKDKLLDTLTDEINKLKQPKDHAKEIQAKQRELENKNRLLLELTRKFTESLIPEIAYTMTAKSYQTEIEELIQQIDALQLDVADNRAINHLEWCKKELERILNLDHTQLNEILFGRITKKIVVYPLNVIEIHLSFLTAPIRMRYKTSGKGAFYKVESTILDQSEFEELMKDAPRNEIPNE